MDSFIAIVNISYIFDVSSCWSNFNWKIVSKFAFYTVALKPGFHIAVGCLRLLSATCHLPCSRHHRQLSFNGNAFLRYRRHLFDVPLSYREATVTAGRKLNKFNYLSVVTVVSWYRQRIITNGDVLPATPCDYLRDLKMADGWWLMADGWWLMADGWWLMADGWWLMADGWWLMADGWWLMADGWWLMADGWWLMADGWWLMADGWWLMADGRWQMADGRWQKAIAGTLRLQGNQASLREQPNYFRRTIIRPTIWRHSHAPTYSIYFALWLAKVSFAGNNV